MDPVCVKEMLSSINFQVWDLSILGVRTDPCKELAPFWNFSCSNCAGAEVSLTHHISSVELLKDTCAKYKNLSSAPLVPDHGRSLSVCWS